MIERAMCRICLVQNVRMYVVVNKTLQDFYKKLTGVPFVTEHGRPMLLCSFCCAKLKQCARFQRKCREAEVLFTRMLKKDYEPQLLINHSKFFGGFIKTPMEQISIVDECKTESVAIKEELPADCETQDDIIEPKEELQSNELKQENLHNSYSDVKDIPLQHSEADSEDDVPLMELKIEVEEEQEVPMMKPSVSETHGVPSLKTPKLDLRSPEPENTITDKRKKSEHKLKKTGEKHFKCEICQVSFSRSYHLKTHRGIHTGEILYNCEVCQRSFKKPGYLTRHSIIHTRKNTVEKPFKCNICQYSCNFKSAMVIHIRTHTGEKPYKCHICQRRFSLKNFLINHIRIHTGEKPYKCHMCEYSCRVKGNLVNHIRIHTRPCKPGRYSIPEQSSDTGDLIPESRNWGLTINSYSRTSLDVK